MEGNNIRIELRWSAADAETMKTFAKELVDLRPDLIFSQTTPAITALARETQTIPIVFLLVSDPEAGRGNQPFRQRREEHRRKVIGD
jgi:putative tryptophan/tyrosine transport system substrate-binding protein